MAHTQIGRPNTHEAPTRENTHKHKQTHSPRHTKLLSIYLSRGIYLSGRAFLHFSFFFVLWHSLFNPKTRWNLKHVIFFWETSAKRALLALAPRKARPQPRLGRVSLVK